MKHFAIIFSLAWLAVTAPSQHRRRGQVQRDCGDRESIVTQDLATCAERARAAQQAARAGSPLVRLFFKADDENTRSTVADLLGKIAKECASTGGGATRITCHDAGGECGRSDALPDLGGPRVLLCDKYFRNPNEKSCGGLDSASVMLHEMTHAMGATHDFKIYGFKQVMGLHPSMNIQHADTYAIFAHAVALNCTKEDLEKEGSAWPGDTGLANGDLTDSGGSPDGGILPPWGEDDGTTTGPSPPSDGNGDRSTRNRAHPPLGANQDGNSQDGPSPLLGGNEDGGQQTGPLHPIGGDQEGVFRNGNPECDTRNGSFPPLGGNPGGDPQNGLFPPLGGNPGGDPQNGLFPPLGGNPGGDPQNDLFPPLEGNPGASPQAGLLPPFESGEEGNGQYGPFQTLTEKGSETESYPPFGSNEEGGVQTASHPPLDDSEVDGARFGPPLMISNPALDGDTRAGIDSPSPQR
ncbi:hypothetical protein DCS_03060 [Drechmeria coniospora]|uniref:Neutral protease 2 n=1 Tax=Drechmeria coniospora TaxID=98403 RepID=A0A151GXT6_DRECN|nr:hypothetical protein DCS_03060 [Drechmeria coniospora]KYK61915.1 hypothetical protein DCS_03060 [Drechmeria coniospora]